MISHQTKQHLKEALNMIKTRVAYGTHKNGNTYCLGDTVADALKANMMVRDYEKELRRINPQLEITVRIEEK